MRIAIGLRLGTTLCHPHTCQCGKSVDNLGRHGLSCLKAQGRHSRHAHANDILLKSLGTAQVPTLKEPKGLCRDDEKRPDGLTLMPWSQGKSLVWDFTCWDTLAPSYVKDSSSQAGNTALKAQNSKISKYQELTDAGYTVMPVAVETMGSWAPMGLKFVKDIGSRITESTGEKRATNYLFQAF